MAYLSYNITNEMDWFRVGADRFCITLHTAFTVIGFYLFLSSVGMLFQVLVKSRCDPGKVMNC